jgi:hypothetical protein
VSSCPNVYGATKPVTFFSKGRAFRSTKMAVYYRQLRFPGPVEMLLNIPPGGVRRKSLAAAPSQKRNRHLLRMFFSFEVVVFGVGLCPLGYPSQMRELRLNSLLSKSFRGMYPLMKTLTMRLPSQYVLVNDPADPQGPSCSDYPT